MVLTKTEAIERLDDVERLRAVALRMWEAFFASHSQTAHMVAAVYLGECDQCVAYCTGDAEPCAEWKAWQEKVTAGFGSV